MTRSLLLLPALLFGCPSDKGITVHHSPPAVSITAPGDGETFALNDPITFTAAVEDDRDANQDLALTWTSDRDGALNTDPADASGLAQFTTAALTVGTHVITLQALNSQALSAEDFITLTVTDEVQEPSITIRAPRTTDEGVEGVAFRFEVLVSDAQDEGPDLSLSFASDLDGEFCTPTADADGLAECDFALSPGDHALTMTVTDLDGNSADATVDFVVQAADASDDDLDGYTEAEGDCDDADSSVHPGATEYANEVDDDCDGEIDEGTLTVDDDGDGYAEADGDCDDGDADSFPGALEVCDGLDNDCDLAIDDGTSCVDDDGDGFTETDGDCDDTDGNAYPGATELPDGADDDCDGTIDEGTSAYDDDGDCACEVGPCLGSVDAACVSPTDGDCDDGDDAVSPLADETCNSVDDDCDGVADEADAIDASTWYADADGDRYGDAATSTASCSAPAGYVNDATDCDDGRSAVHPGAAETCDSLDDDCDGATDESDATDAGTWYADTDADGYGDPTVSARSCALPSGYSASAEDCDDTDADVNPDADELCNSVDDDCDGTTDEPDALDAVTWWDDADGDGYGGATSSIVSCTRPGAYSAVSTDCNDANAAVSPAATETCNSTDDDCDGSTDEGVTSTYYRDADGDGYGTSTTTTTGCSAPSGYVSNSSDCDDTDATLTPSTVWYRDSDGDGYGDASATRTQCAQPSGYVDDDTDCNDSSTSAHPGRTEACDSLDNDCDGSTDEINATGCTAYYVDADADGYGATGTSSRCYCSATSTYTATNNDDCYDGNSSANPAATAYYTTDRGDGSYDYNCDGTSTKRYTDLYDCTGAVYVCVDYTNGWNSSIPSCGSSASWKTGCSATLTTCSYASGSSRTQSCR